MKAKKFWIKERHNPQTGVYYVACGQLSATKAKDHGRAIYGENVMHGFDSEAAYMARIEALRAKGERVT